MVNKNAIVVGARGMDGSFMCDLLSEKGYNVLRIDRNSVYALRQYIMQLLPEVVYNFSGVSDVINPYDNLNEIFETNARLPQIILEEIYKTDKNIKYFQASSALIFGKDKSGSQNEQTPTNPINPYGAAKLYATNITKMYREDLGLFACSGIFFPHISERSKDHFFAKKICKAAATKTKITVGKLFGLRDWGYAKDYTEAAYLMMQANTPKDYVIGTGILTLLREFTKKAFDYVGLDYRDYIIEDETQARKNDTEVLCADYSEIKNDLGWEPKTDIDTIIKKIIDGVV